MNKPLKLHLVAIGDGLAVGLLAGLSSSLFLYALSYVTNLFKASNELLWCLPLAGLLTSVIYQQFGGTSEQGNHLIIDEVHQPKARIPWMMAPLVFITTLGTHLFGGSAGREGTAVQMGAGLADVVARFFNADSERRRRLLICGMGAGFGAAIGTPFAGAIFGMEVLRVGRLRPVAVIESFIASYFAYAIAHLLNTPHTIYPNVDTYFTYSTIIYLVFAGIIFGFLARFFIFLAHGVETFSAKFIKIKFLRPFIIGSVLIALFKLEGTTRLNGLGIDIITDSFNRNVEASLPTLKAIFTALTVGSGFKGGEFTPLAYIGATAGSAMAIYFPVSTSLFAAMGFSAVFGAASKTPIACAVMAAELFGIETLPFALLTCLIAHHCAGMTSIYRYQEAESLVLISRIKKWIKDYKRSGNR